MTTKGADILRVGIGVAGLCFGALIYVLDRPADYVYFLPGDNPWFTGYLGTFGAAGLHLPTFIHPFCFAVITAGVLRCRSAVGVALISMGWFLLDAAFELLQRSSIGPTLVEYIPAGFEHIPVLENVSNYLVNGTFDPKDIISIAAGSLAALLLNLLLNQGRGDSEDLASV